ncbi:SAC3/GANP/Nin1/mts3/eIF-3 p25 family-domain-containing protein [Collybia nuda]|uniref:SAC3/GANP/Nin1/mts3/eIF-3 p25 family-domain-containing protein n=1 Tax=Collybia nuda TaxID=64659 RepID=A0A9P5YB66_9AGAR|nr:SAC3/GANP/Nin1/mts3/eIF-3 p25 family-domain-containing protein [Collybia nuda]
MYAYGSMQNPDRYLLYCCVFVYLAHTLMEAFSLANFKLPTPPTNIYYLGRDGSFFSCAGDPPAWKWGRQTHSRNKHWVAGENSQRSGESMPHSDGERWERGGHRGGRGARGTTRGGRGKFTNVSLRTTRNAHNLAVNEESREEEDQSIEEDSAEQEARSLETPEEREKFYQELVKAREVERKVAIAEGKMDDPTIPKRLEDAISVVGTCLDMCPRFERYRRERENNLFEWETIPGTKRVDHKRAVKMYERAAGDKTLPSDLRPPHVLKKTLDYLFHDLLPRGGFSQTFNFIRDRSRAVRNDFTMQHNYGPLAIECHDRCARFHILALHFERDRAGFSVALEEQQLMNTLQSLKEFYEDQRGRYESPTELEMRVYHRLIHIRDQKERHEDIPEHITAHPVFQLTTDFRVHVQRKSAPISKNSPLIVDEEGMHIFGRLANVLREQGSVVMIYLVACILERLFGKDAIDDIEAIREDLDIPDIIDGISSDSGYEQHIDDDMQEDKEDDDEQHYTGEHELSFAAPTPLKPGRAEWASSNFRPPPTAPAFGSPPPALSTVPPSASAFSTIATTPNVFATPSPFGSSTFTTSSSLGFGTVAPIFGAPPATSINTLPAQTNSTANGSVLSNSMAPNPFGSKIHSFFGGSPNPLTAPVTSPLPLEPETSLRNSFSLPLDRTGLSTDPVPLFDGRPSGSRSFTLGKPTQYLANDFSPSFPNSSPTAGPTPNSTAPASTSHGPETFTPQEAFQRSSNPSPAAFPPAPNPLSTPITIFPSPSQSFPSSKKPTPPSPLRQRSLSQRSSATPPLPKIKTDTPSSFPRPEQVPTPSAPPLLPKHQPISLPSTPTSTIPPPNPRLGLIRNTLESTTSGANNEILSPLFLPSPTTSGHSIVHNFTPNGNSRSILSNTSPGSVNSLINGKGKVPLRSFFDPDTVDDDATPEELIAQSLRFAQKSLVVKHTLARWQKRATDHAAWIEACRQSDAYHQKIQKQRISTSPQSEKKRRPSMDSELHKSVQRKRTRKRISSTYQPRQSDEELARRFKEAYLAHYLILPIQNHDEHERRWAQGSFLQVIVTHVKSKLNGLPLNTAWNLWLSMNPDTDATAIWLERKFNVPDAGYWVSETIFSISLTKDPTAPDFPGIIVFECTPLEGIADDLERKYRVLDDCARLRDTIQALPPTRYFRPSILVLYWAEGEQAKPPTDFLDMLNKTNEESAILGYSILSITSATKDLDGKLAEALTALSLDLEGEYVRSLSIRGAFKLFEPPFVSFISEWTENCYVTGSFDWILFGQILQATLAILNGISYSVLDLTEIGGPKPFPLFQGGEVQSSSSAYEYVSKWLSDAGLGEDATSIVFNLQSHKNIGQDFPAREFLQQLWNLTEIHVEILARQRARSTFYIPTAGITISLEAYLNAFQSHKDSLGQALNLSIRRSPKRRSVSEDTELASSQESKRRRLLSPVDSDDATPSPATSPYLNGRDIPSPTNTTTSLAPSETPIVTIAMLRALTRDVKKKYAE